MGTENVIKSDSADIPTLQIKLLQGFIFSSEVKRWNQLLIHQDSVRQYFKGLRLSLLINEEDGFAYLKNPPKADLPENQPDSKGDEQDQISLIRKIPLSYDLSLLCVLLRERLSQFDTETSDDYRFILAAVDIYEMLKTYFPSTNDEVKQKRKFDGLINKLVDLKFLKLLNSESNTFEVRNVIKSFIDADCLLEIKKQMENNSLEKKSNKSTKKVIH